MSDIELKQNVLKLSKTMEDLQTRVATPENQMNWLRNEVTDLKKRVSAQEKYTDKDYYLSQLSFRLLPTELGSRCIPGNQILHW